jgi:hypothetical protein
MKPKCAYPNTQSAANAVHRWIKRSGVPLELTARPWNRFEPVNTEWWLIPSTAWPAYRHGKYFFQARSHNRVLYCGLFVEKGLDPSIAVAFPTGKRLVMDNSWVWHRLMAEIGSGYFGEAMSTAAANCPCPLRLVVDGGFVEDPASYDPQAPPMDWNYVTYESDGSVLHCRSSRGDQFAHLVDSQNLDELIRAIQQTSHLAWTWVDFHVGLELEVASLEHDPERDVDAWEAAELWEKCLAPWQPWIV